MGYVLKWGDRTWIYGGLLGLGFGLAILLLSKDMLGAQAFWNYYSPMLGYYVLISICQSHYFKRAPVPDMKGLFRQFVSIFGAVLIFFVNQFIMITIFAVPETPTAPPMYLEHGGIIMTGHFSFIVFGFFIYGFDDFMFKGKLGSWIRNDTLKAIFWYFVIWAVWYPLFYMKGGIGQGFSTAAFNKGYMDHLLAISQWAIIISLLYALLFRDWLPHLQERTNIKSDLAFGAILLVASFIIGWLLADLCYVLLPDHLSSAEKWHDVLYMGTYPLTPAILLGTYTSNFSSTEDPGHRVLKRLMVLVPSVILLYYAFHLLIAEPYTIPNMISPGAMREDIGIFRADGGWFHQLDLYFNFTVSIIPLTHHWFTGKAGFMKEVDDPPERPIRTYRQRRGQITRP
jgi:hypothetical protein